MKFATVHNSLDWEESLARCNELLRPLLGSVRQVVREGGNASIHDYLTAFGVPEA